MRKRKARELRCAALLAAQGATDAQALSMPSLYPEWVPGGAYELGAIVSWSGGLYRCAQAHTTQTEWEPGTVPALWTAIDQSHTGTTADPIPAARGMEYVYGKYYADPEDGGVYLCRRTGEAEGGAVVLRYLPHELVGQYFERME